MAPSAQKEKLSFAGKQVDHLFLGEGQAEKGLLKRLLALARYQSSDVHIACLQGIDGLGAALRSLMSEPEWQSLHAVTIILDSDYNPKDRWNSIWDTLGSLLASFGSSSAETKPFTRAGKRNGWAIHNGIRYAV